MGDAYLVLWTSNIMKGSLEVTSKVIVMWLGGHDSSLEKTFSKNTRQDINAEYILHWNQRNEGRTSICEHGRA